MQETLKHVCSAFGALLIVVSLVNIGLTIKRWIKEDIEANKWLNDKK